MPNSVTVDAFSIPDINYLGTTAKLRRYYLANWQDQDGTLHLAGTPGISTDSFDEIDCTLVDHLLSAPSFEAAVTLFNGASPLARETWQLWDEGGTARDLIAENWFIPLSPNPTSREILQIANQGQSLAWPPNIYLGELGVQQLIDAQVPAPDAGAATKGITKLSVAPVIAGDPIALGQNDPILTTPVSTADSKAVSAGTRASVADSKAVSDSGLISTAQSGVISSSVVMSSLTSRVSSNE